MYVCIYIYIYIMYVLAHIYIYIYIYTIYIGLNMSRIVGSTIRTEHGSHVHVRLTIRCDVYAKACPT